MAIAAPQSERDIYANLLRDTRALRRDQASARDAWYAQLGWDEKEQSLFELEMLLKGTVCLGNARNLPGPIRDDAAVGHDYREELMILRDASERIVALARSLLGDREKAYTFNRYLGSMLPEDFARGQLLKGQLAPDTPIESLLVLARHLRSLPRHRRWLLKNSHISHKQFAALHAVVAARWVGTSSSTRWSPLEFRPEFDRIRAAEVLESLSSIENESAHRVLALTMLSLFRALRYLELVDEYAATGVGVRRGYVLLAVLRSDLRALTRYLGKRSGDVIADGMERELMAVPAASMRSRFPSLAQRCVALATIRTTLGGVANTLSVEIRKVFLRDLPGTGRPISSRGVAPVMIVGSASLRASCSTRSPRFAA